MGVIIRRQIISSSRPSCVVLILSNLTVAAYSDTIYVWLVFSIVFCVESFQQKRENGWRIKFPGGISYVWNGSMELVMYLGCLADPQEIL